MEDKCVPEHPSVVHKPIPGLVTIAPIQHAINLLISNICFQKNHLGIALLKMGSLSGWVGM